MAVLSAMAGLTAEFGMGSGDPCLHGRAREGLSSSRAYMRLSSRARGRPDSCMADVAHDAKRIASPGSEELGLLVPLA